MHPWVACFYKVAKARSTKQVTLFGEHSKALTLNLIIKGGDAWHRDAHRPKNGLSKTTKSSNSQRWLHDSRTFQFQGEEKVSSTWWLEFQFLNLKGTSDPSNLPNQRKFSKSQGGPIDSSTLSFIKTHSRPSLRQKLGCLFFLYCKSKLLKECGLPRRILIVSKFKIEISKPRIINLKVDDL